MKQVTRYGAQFTPIRRPLTLTFNKGDSTINYTLVTYDHPDLAVHTSVYDPSGAEVLRLIGCEADDVHEHFTECSGYGEFSAYVCEWLGRTQACNTADNEQA